MKVIAEFRDGFSFLSNFWFAETEYDNVIYPTREHAFQAAKAFPSYFLTIVNKNGEEVLVNYRQAILACKTPGTAKRLGKRAKLRPNWETIKYSVMYEVVLDCFSRNPDLKKKLLQTEDTILEEGNNWHDTYWGICNGKCRRGPHQPLGENNHGKILMEVREKLKNKEETK